MKPAIQSGLMRVHSETEVRAIIRERNSTEEWMVRASDQPRASHLSSCHFWRRISSLTWRSLRPCRSRQAPKSVVGLAPAWCFKTAEDVFQSASVGTSEGQRNLKKGPLVDTAGSTLLTANCTATNTNVRYLTMLSDGGFD